jgi:hypothetical protein
LPVILDTWEAEMGRIKILQQIVSKDPLSKITRAKWTEGVAQHLLCKFEALSPNPSLTKKKKKKKIQNET